MNHIMTVFEQIKPLVSKLSDGERLELIRTIAMTLTKPGNGPVAIAYGRAPIPIIPSEQNVLPEYVIHNPRLVA